MEHNGNSNSYEHLNINSEKRRRRRQRRLEPGPKSRRGSAQNLVQLAKELDAEQHLERSIVLQDEMSDKEHADYFGFEASTTAKGANLEEADSGFNPS